MIEKHGKVLPFQPLLKHEIRPDVSPFYTAFLSQEKTNLVYEVMENGGNRTHTSIEKIIGMGGNKVKKANYLKYCPICFKKDMEKFGRKLLENNASACWSHVLL